MDMNNGGQGGLEGIGGAEWRGHRGDNWDTCNSIITYN